ncbi:MAG: 16S rRNA (uracil(1498)-N(3))-methyltransferase [bacterium TMED88]|nr:16S rRNA (uracil(1498)-N(3))-methyltransferase [Deltaproteobacteria bacterium]OUV37618.1 MAG: 16S rRNA (uracil(1498)-N(3))-methyltransferase [bacterium TMED88]
MNLVLLEDTDFVAPGQVRLEGRRHRHLRKILRVDVGDVVLVGQLAGSVGRGRVDKLDSQSVFLSVELNEGPPAALPITLVLALPRPPVLRRVLSGVSAMGVKRICLIDTESVEKSFWQSHGVLGDSIREQLMLGLEQSRDTRLPDVSLHRDFGIFAKETLPRLLDGVDGYLAHPAPARSVPPGSGAALLAVGPEAGWTEVERDWLAELGLMPLGLGMRALRVETAVPALIARLL